MATLLSVVYIIQILYLCGTNTTRRRRARRPLPLCISFKFCIFAAQTQPSGAWKKKRQVVYIIQILYLCGTNTTLFKQRLLPQVLCISFKFCIFAAQTQLAGSYSECEEGCVYHSNFVSLRHKHNLCIVAPKRVAVVYIIQILYLCGTNTTHSA